MAGPPGDVRGYRRPHWNATVDLPHSARGWRTGRWDVACRLVEVQRQHERLGRDECRRGTGLRLPANEHTDQRPLRGPSAGRQPVRGKCRGSRRARLGNACGIFRPSIMASGTTTCRPRPSWPTSPLTAGAGKSWRKFPNRHSSTSWTGKQARPIWPIDERPVPQSTVPGEACPRLSRFRRGRHHMIDRESRSMISSTSHRSCAAKRRRF